MQISVKTNSLKRLKTVRGHLDHVITMVDEGKYCIDILQQSSALQSALRSFDGVILKGHLEEHASMAMRKKGNEKDKSIQEILDIFNKGRR